MPRRLFPFLALLAACSPVPPVPDAAPDGQPADDHPQPPDASDAQPAADATVDASSLDARADVLELDAAADASPDVVTRDSSSDAGDASAPPDIRVEHPAMAVRATLRLTCAPGMP
jgi:hypothetical protein